MIKIYFLLSILFSIGIVFFNALDCIHYSKLFFKEGICVNQYCFDFILNVISISLFTFFMCFILNFIGGFLIPRLFKLNRILENSFFSIISLIAIFFVLFFAFLSLSNAEFCRPSSDFSYMILYSSACEIDWLYLLKFVFIFYIAIYVVFLFFPLVYSLVNQMLKSSK